MLGVRMNRLTIFNILARSANVLAMCEDLHLSAPLSVYDSIFSLRKSDSVTEFLSEITSTVESSISKIPLLGATFLECIPDGHLVRLIGMVQDMFNTELFIDEFRLSTAKGEEFHTLRYRDFGSYGNQENLSPMDIKFAERQSFYIVSVPGECQWVQQGRAKVHNFITPNQIVGCKRSFNSPLPTETKKSKCQFGEFCSVKNVKKINKHFPVKEEEQDDSKFGIILRVYDIPTQTKLKLNDIIEVFGILEHARLYNTTVDENHFGQEEKCSEPSPRVHAIIVRQLTHNNPFLTADWELLLGYRSNLVQEIRTKLIGSLSKICCGDELVAEYLLLHLISSRLTSSFPSNLSSINIYLSSNMNQTDESANELIKFKESMQIFLPHFVTQFVNVECNIKSLNEGPILIPVRDQDKGHLNAGRLQLCSGTQVFVDETNMDSGQLQARGLLNFQALSNLSVRQRVIYDFQFYTQEWDTNLRVIIISILPSLIKSVFPLPWQPREDYTKLDLNANISAEDWISMRNFITLLNCSKEIYSIDNELQERINQDFVDWRRDKSTFIEPEEFASMLSLLRFYTLTNGAKSPTLEYWLTICQFEKDRKSRINGRNSNRK